MKVILLQEVKGRGGEGDIVDVARGYAVNYLYPRKIAVEATKGNLKQLEARKHNIEKREAQRLDTADKLVAALSEKSVTIKARVGEEGHLFGSVTTTQIAEAIASQIGAEVDRKKIDLHAAIKTVGEHSATISIYRDVKAVLTVLVVNEKTEDETPAEAEDVAETAEDTRGADAMTADVIDETQVEANEAIAEASAAEEIAEDATTVADAVSTGDDETEAETNESPEQ